MTVTVDQLKALHGEISEFHERMKAEVADVSKTIEERTAKAKEHDDKIEKMQARLDSMYNYLTGTVSLGIDKREAKKFSIRKAAMAMIRQKVDGEPRDIAWKDAGFEHEVLAEARKLHNGHKKAIGDSQSSQEDTAGGALIPTEISSDIIELLRPNIILGRLGARQMPNLMGSPHKFIRLKGGAVARWGTTGSPIQASKSTLGSLTLEPRQLSCFIPIERQLVELASASEALFRDDMAQAMAEEMDRAGFLGAGDENEPLGIINTPGIKGPDTDGTDYDAATALSWEVLQDFITAVDKAKALRGSLGWAFPPTGRLRVATVKDGNGRPLTLYDSANVVMPSMQGTVPGIAGYPWATSTQLRETLAGGTQMDFLFGNFAEVLLGTWGGFRMEVTTEGGDAFLNDELWIKMVQYADIGLRHPESFCYSGMIKLAIS